MRRMSGLLTLTLTFLIAATVDTRASDERSEPTKDAAIVAHVFEVSDFDSDGYLSSDEYGKAGLDAFGISFEECDRDSNGELTIDEYLAVYQQHHPVDSGLDV